MFLAPSKIASSKFKSKASAIAARSRLVLSVVATDSTFEEMDVRGTRAHVGKCIFCNSKIVVELNGDTLATVEHIVPRTHGGTDDPENLALACRRCNGSKGIRVDPLPHEDPRRNEIVHALLERRKERWRDP